MGYKLGYHILVLPNQILLINSVLTNEVLLYISTPSHYCKVCYWPHARNPATYVAFHGKTRVRLFFGNFQILHFSHDLCDIHLLVWLDSHFHF